MTTYLGLLNDVLALCDSVGDTGATNVAKIALEHTMRLVSSRVYLRQLVGSATFTVVTVDDPIPMDGGGFGVSDFSTPNRLYVNGTPYEFREFLGWLDLKNVPAGQRIFITETSTYDARPNHVWTLDADNNILLAPSSVGDVVTLYYNKQPAAYSDAGIPELPPEHDTILLSAACMVVKEYLKDPDTLLDIFALISSPSILAQIQDLDNKLNSNRKRMKLKVSRRYSAPVRSWQ